MRAFQHLALLVEVEVLKPGQQANTPAAFKWQGSREKCSQKIFPTSPARFFLVT
jgi:hypothetical protein